MAKSTSARAIPTGSTEPISVLLIDDPIEDITGIKIEQIAAVANSTKLRKIANQTTAAVGTEFPFDDTGVETGGGGSTITLSAGAPAIDLTGFLVVTTSGTGALQVRRITAYNTGTKQVTVNRAWTTQPISGTTYTILLETFRLSALLLKAEFANVLATDPSITVTPIFYDVPDYSGGLFDRAPMRYPGLNDIVIPNLGYAEQPADSTYKLARSRSESCLGSLGAKIRVTQIPSGAYSLWASVA